MRILIDLPETQIQALAALGERTRQPRAVVIREAIAEYLERCSAKPVEAAYGLWGADYQDGLDYQEKARSEW